MEACDKMRRTDHGPEPYVTNIEYDAKCNTDFRVALWTGNHLQLTLMSISPGDEIGLEIHPDTDQFLYIERGKGLVKMGKEQSALTFQREVYDGYGIFVPAGTWHNLMNTGVREIKLFSVYAPPESPRGTVQPTRESAYHEEHKENPETNRMENSQGNQRELLQTPGEQLHENHREQNRTEPNENMQNRPGSTQRRSQLM